MPEMRRVKNSNRVGVTALTFAAWPYRALWECHSHGQKRMGKIHKAGDQRLRTLLAGRGDIGHPLLVTLFEQESRKFDESDYHSR